MEKKVKRKINIKGLFFIILVLYLIVSFGYYIFTMPLKNIVIGGNNYLTDNEVIRLSGLSDYPNVFKISMLKIKKNLKSNNLIDDVNIRKNIFGKITINIRENRILFLNALSNKIVLANGSVIDYSSEYLSVPTLINYVPSNIYDDLIKGLNSIEDIIIKEISEIEYSPDKSGEIVFDEARFLLRMNDGNIVYINTPNIKKLNRYNNIYEEVGGNGILYLDSNSENYIYKKS